MKVQIRNISNKKRSQQAIDELKAFANKIAYKLGIENKIDVVQLIYTKQFSGYYYKEKPMYGFHKLFNNNKVRIDLTRHWDISQTTRKKAIIHELTHVKQIIEKRLIINKNFTEAKWNGKVNQSWRKFRFKELDNKGRISANKYLRKFLPWEGEVQLNISKFIK